MGRVQKRMRPFSVPKRKEDTMRRFYTAESVTEGHPDKVCDRIADTILDTCLKEDPDARVACEVLATKGTVLLAGEITSRYVQHSCHLHHRGRVHGNFLLCI